MIIAVALLGLTVLTGCSKPVENNVENVDTENTEVVDDAKLIESTDLNINDTNIVIENPYGTENSRVFVQSGDDTPDGYYVSDDGYYMKKKSYGVNEDGEIVEIDLPSDSMKWSPVEMEKQFNLDYVQQRLFNDDRFMDYRDIDNSYVGNDLGDVLNVINSDLLSYINKSIYLCGYLRSVNGVKYITSKDGNTSVIIKTSNSTYDGSQIGVCGYLRQNDNEELYIDVIFMDIF